MTYPKHDCELLNSVADKDCQQGQGILDTVALLHGDKAHNLWPGECTYTE